MILIIDNVRSAYNVGSLFRTADAVGVEEIYLLGVSPLPLDRFGREDKEIAKTGLGAHKSVPWKYGTIEECIAEMKERSYAILVLEQHEGSVNCFDYIPKVGEKAALVVGNEVGGVSAEFLTGEFTYLELPMKGEKESLNVSVAGGAAMYLLRYKLPE
jgi:23S rRNA (guanosine2251-2'-O)-methyltransferase